MSLETSIGDLIASVNALRNEYAGKRDQINAALAEALSASVNATRTVFVDPAGGSDTNVGSPTAPVMTIDRAIEMVSDMVYGRILLLGNVKMMHRHEVACQHLEIAGASYVPGAANETPAVARGLQYASETTPAATGERRSAGIYIVGGGTVTFSNIVNTIPNVPAAIAVKTLYSFNSGGALIMRNGSIEIESAETTATFADVWIPGRLVFGFSGGSIAASANGKILGGVAAGANPNSRWQYTSNLTSL